MSSNTLAPTLISCKPYRPVACRRTRVPAVMSPYQAIYTPTSLHIKPYYLNYKSYNICIP